MFTNTVDLFIFCHFWLMCKEDRHVVLTAQSAVNATWRVFERTDDNGATERTRAPHA